jgi:hypothetical protein
MFAALESIEDNGEVSRAWENIRQNIKISAQETPGYCKPEYHKT